MHWFGANSNNRLQGFSALILELSSPWFLSGALVLL